jgi:thiamine transporter ThiT
MGVFNGIFNGVLDGILDLRGKAYAKSEIQGIFSFTFF